MGVTLEDEAPRLAEINRSIQDFRNEFREAVKSMVRRDVYDANMQTMQLQINQLDAKISGLQKEREQDEKERSSTRALAIGIAIPGTISFLIAIVNWLTR
jgi:predicted  nucleic acid-binding Zn-ribbon protein